MAQLSKGNLREVQEVLSRLKNGDTLINQGQSLSVANQMLSNMSGDDIAFLAQKRSGNQFLKSISEEIKTSKTGAGFDVSSLFNSTKIENAREKALSNILGDKAVSQSNWEKNGLGGDAALNRLRVLDDDKKKAREIFDRLYPDKKNQALVSVKQSEAAKELDYLEKLVVQNKYNQTIDRAVAEIKPEFPQLDEKTLKALLIQESGLNPNASNSAGFVGIAQIGTNDIRQGNITLAERNDPQKAIPAAVRILRAKMRSLEEGNAPNGYTSPNTKVGEAWGFKKYGTPKGDDYIKFMVASYNRGEGNIAQAMDYAYEDGKKIAQKSGLSGDEAEQFAKNYATRWDNLVNAQNPNESPLRKATSERGYNEVIYYVQDITNLSRRK